MSLKPIKPWLSLEQQLSKLQERGLKVDDSDAALNYLKRLGYYRLSGYWYPLRVIDTDASRHNAPVRLSEFAPDSQFEDVVKLYVFDKKLRLLALDALERIEMAVRVDIAYLLGQYDPLAHEQKRYLHGGFTKQQINNGPNRGKTKHQVWLEKYETLVWRARKEPFIQHHQGTYRRLPIWVAIEVWDFGMTSMLFAGMKVSDQDQIAMKYGAADGRAFASWLRSFNFIRNVSAHHSRLWNINVLERAPLLRTADFWQRLSNARPFFYFCLMQKMLRVICPNSSWSQRLLTTIGEFPNPSNTMIGFEDFGVVDGWESWELWGFK